MRARGSGWLHVRAGEAAPIAILVGWYFCVIGAAFVARSVRDSLFLAHLSAARLPAMYVATPLIVTAVGFAYARIEGRLRRDRLAIGTAVASASVLVLARLLLGTGDWIYYALYVAVSVISGLVIMQLWMAAGDRFTSRDAKRLFGLVGAGGTLADIAIGAVLALLAPRMAVEDLLYLAAGLLFAAAALAVTLGRLGGPVQARPRPSRARGAPAASRPPGASHLGLVGLCLVCAVVVVTLVEFQFKSIAGDHFGTDRAGMVRYFGAMSIATGVVSLLIQLTATRWALQRLGVVGVLLLLPLGLGAGEAALLLAPGLIAATVLKATDETLRFTVNDAASQLLFLPVPSSARGRWKALVDNVWKPGAQLTLGLALMAYRALTPGRIAPLVVTALGVIVLWIGLVARLRAAYVRSLRDTLRRPHDEAGVIPGEELAAVRAALLGDAPAAILAALELVPSGATGLWDTIAPLTEHADAQVRRAACAALAGCRTPAHRARLRTRLADEDDGVRAAALAVLLAGPAVEAEALLARDRLAGAITDADPAVARAAVTTAATVGDPALLSPLLARLRASGGRDPMMGDALTACGRGAEDALARALSDPALPIPARSAVAQAMGRLGGPVMVARLLDVIEAGPPVTSDAVRTAAMRALARAARRHTLPDDQRARVDRVIDAELTAGYRAMAAADGLGAVESLANPDGTRAAPRFLPASEGGAEALLSRSLRDRHDACRDRVLLLVAALHPGTGVDTIAANLREPDPARRANAVEALDSALDRDLRARVIPLVDESPRPDKLAAVRARFALRHRDVNQWVADLLSDPAPWLVACTAHYAGAVELGSARPRLEQLRTHTDATVREAVADALARLRRPHA